MLHFIKGCAAKYIVQYVCSITRSNLLCSTAQCVVACCMTFLKTWSLGWSAWVTVLLTGKRLALQAPNQDAFCFQNLYAEWEEKLACKIITSTRGTFMDMFDDDDTLMYEPPLTAAVIMTGDDEEAEKAALEVNRQCQNSML